MFDTTNDSCATKTAFAATTTTTTPPSAAIVLDPADLYDPSVPNDLLHYWERARAARERQRLQRQHAERLQQQEALRHAAAQERQALAQAGQYHVLLAQQIQKTTARGRGRGVSNVPASMLKQQQQQQQQQQAAGGHGSGGDGEEPSFKRSKHE